MLLDDHNYKKSLVINNDGKDLKYRFTSVVDAAAREFEVELLRRPRVRPYQPATPLPIELPLYQRTCALEAGTGTRRLLQVWDASGLPACQIVAEISRPGGLRRYGAATVRGYGCQATDHQIEAFALGALTKLLVNTDRVRKIRIQAYRAALPDLADFYNLGGRAGYRLVDPIGVGRTIVYDLTPSIEDLLKAFDRKTRWKVRHSSRANVEIRKLDDPKWIPAMQTALDSSFARTSRVRRVEFDFEFVFNLARLMPECVLMLGLFMKERPDALLAYSIDVLHGATAEALSGGSLPDAELRKLPFNYLLAWDRIQWAKASGANILDMGGVTDGGQTDPLAGISAFKRRFSERETEIGREMELTPSPLLCLIFRALRALKRLASG